MRSWKLHHVVCTHAHRLIVWFARSNSDVKLKSGSRRPRHHSPPARLQPGRHPPPPLTPVFATRNHAFNRYPSLIFREHEKLGSVFRLVTKDTDREDELLFPLSALTPPPPPGRSHLPPTWASSLPEVRVSTAEAVALPELVRSGALTPGQGAAAVEMFREEDPVVFAACRVAGAAAAAAASGGSGGIGGGGSLGDGGGGSRNRGWSNEAKNSFASMLKLVLYARDGERGGVVEQARGESDGFDLGMVAGRGEGSNGGDEEGVWGRAERFLGGDDSYARPEVGARGEEEETKSRDSLQVPETFQLDTIALADVALVTGKVKKTFFCSCLVCCFDSCVDRGSCRRRG